MEPQATAVTLDAFRRAVEETKRLKHASVRAEHILLGVLQLSEGSAASALDASGVDREAIGRQVEESLPPPEAEPHEGEYPYHPSGVAVLQHLMAAAPPGEQGTITSSVVLLALLGVDSVAIRQAFTSVGVDTGTLTSRLSDSLHRPE